MTEVATSGSQKKRRLPAWMLPDKSSDERSLGNIDCRSATTEQIEQQATGTKAKSIFLAGRTDVSDDFGTLIMKVAKQKTKKLNNEQSKVDTSMKKLAEDKTKTRKIKGNEVTKQKGLASKKQKQTVRRSDKNEIISSRGGDEDEIELTEEDLLCIAQEYVEADRKKQQEFYTARKSESTKCSSRHISTSAASSQEDALGVLHSSGSSKLLRKCSMTAFTSDATDTKVDRKSPEDDLAKNVTRTGDAARDMLNLLLGPLLNNPADTEKGSRDALNESIPSTYDINNPVRKKTRKDEISLTKKKGSLKDKVAMLLD